MSSSPRYDAHRRDLMHGPRLAELGFTRKKAGGHGAIAAGFQGQRRWTDHFPNGDVLRNPQHELRLDRHPPASFRRPPRTLAQRFASMLFGYLLTNTRRSSPTCAPAGAPSPRGHRLKPGRAPPACSTCVTPARPRWTARAKAVRDGKNVIQKPGTTDRGGSRRHARGHDLHPASTGYFAAAAIDPLPLPRRDARDVLPASTWCAASDRSYRIAEGYTVSFARRGRLHHRERTNIEWPTTWFDPEPDG